MSIRDRQYECFNLFSFFKLIFIVFLFICFLGTSTPISGFGRFIGGITALFGVFTITLPVPIVVNSFSNFYKTRLWRSEVAIKRRDRLIHTNNSTKESAHIGAVQLSLMAQIPCSELTMTFMPPLFIECFDTKHRRVTRIPSEIC